MAAPTGAACERPAQHGMRITRFVALDGKAPCLMVEPDPEARKVAATLASEIEDEELRGLVERAVAASLARAADDRPL